MPDVFELYKPIRNYLRQTQLVESLGVVRAYLQHLQFGEQLPDDTEVAVEFIKAKNRVEKRVYEWELETIVREIIINSLDSRSIILPKDLRRWEHFSTVVNKLKDLENGIGGLYYTKDNILLEIYRIAHRQFPWQLRPNGIWLGRYYKIFSHPKLNSTIQRVTGLSTKELYTFGLALTGFYLKKFALDYPPIIQIRDVDSSKFDLFLARFSKNLPEIRKLMTDSQQFNENYVYAFNPLRKYPLVKMQVNEKESLICPIPTLLFWRFTNGIYYEICDESDFSEPFGESFQSYVGDVLKRATEGKSQFSLIPEEEYLVGKSRKRTVDWILNNQDSALLIEVKTKRLRVEAKTELVSPAVLLQEIDKMADFIVQMYAAIRDYRNNLYPDFRFNPSRRVFPVILTLEDWYLFGKPLEDELVKRITKKFEERGLDRKWLEEMPYSICSIEEFEKMIQIMVSVDIDNFMSKKVFDAEKRLWPLASFMTTVFGEEYFKTRNLFPELIQEINPEILSGSPSQPTPKF